MYSWPILNIEKYTYVLVRKAEVVLSIPGEGGWKRGQKLSKEAG